mgnify:CR=1 FL=1
MDEQAVGEYNFFTYDSGDKGDHQPAEGETSSSSPSSTTAPSEQKRIKYLFSDVGR